MKNIWILFKKELKSYFVSPIAYVMFVVFLILAGYFFFSLTAAFNLQSMHYMRYEYGMGEINVNEMVIRPLFYNFSIILLLMIPLFTMRMYAEEKKSGTLELLMTAPLSNLQLITGKFLGTLAVYMIMLGFTLIYPLILFMYGNPDWGPIASGYVGLLLMGAAYISVGSLCSSFTENQIVAAVISFGVLLFLWVISWASYFVGPDLGEVLSYISIIEHFDDFAKGIMDTKDIVFYLSFILFSLFLTNESLELK
jgi:ABC-2 type transport system permease protein